MKSPFLKIQSKRRLLQGTNESKTPRKMTFYGEKHPLFKYCVSWFIGGEDPRISKFNFHEPVFESHMDDFVPKVNLKPPVHRQIIRSDSFAVQINWEVRYREEKAFVGWTDISFSEEASPEPVAFSSDEEGHWPRVYSLLLRLFSGKRKELRDGKNSFLWDTRINSLNTALNTIRLELLFGLGWRECLVCKKFTPHESLCEDCSGPFYSDDEEELSSAISSSGTTSCSI